MTNFVASILVSVVTNTSDVFPTEQVQVPCPGARQGNMTLAIACFETREVPNPTTKTVITTCKEVTTLKFDWNGPREIISEKVLWQSNVVMKLDWRLDAAR